MSGFSFSHQFSQRWLATPIAVKGAIIQELDDIVTLLQPETHLDTFHFHVSDLNETVESLMKEESLRRQIEQLEAERREAERLEQERLEAEKLEAQRIEQERLEAERIEKERLEQERLRNEQLEEERRIKEQLEAERIEQEKRQQEQLAKERLEQDQAEIAALEQERGIAKQAFINRQNSGTKDDAIEVSVEKHPSELVYAISDSTAEPPSVTSEPQQDSVALPTLTATPDIEKIKQDIIEQLQAHIDTYLLDSMTFMNEDLNKWLKEEVAKQLNERLSPND